jgi:hypothetical protein
LHFPEDSNAGWLTVAENGRNMGLLGKDLSISGKLNLNPEPVLAIDHTVKIEFARNKSGFSPDSK